MACSFSAESAERIIVALDGMAPDQARVMGPAEAIAAGASQLVIGRPIIKAKDPSAAFAKCCAELERLE